MGDNSSTEAVLRVAISCKIMKNHDFFEKMLRKHQCSAHLGTSDVVLSDYLVLWRHNLDQKKFSDEKYIFYHAGKNFEVGKNLKILKTKNLFKKSEKSTPLKAF